VALPYIKLYQIKRTFHQYPNEEEVNNHGVKKNGGKKEEGK